MRDIKRGLIGFFVVLISVICVGINPVQADLSNFARPGASLSLADYSFIGENANDGSGYGIVGAGDVDNDGLDDILIGAPYSGSSYHGRTYLILGSSLGSTAAIDLSTADYVFTGDSGGDYGGISVAGGRDMDGNGQDDILIGASGDSYGGTDSGKTFLFLGENLGSTANLTLSDADYFFGGESSYDGSGASVTLIGDVDGNGLPDILIGAKGNDDGGSNAGKTYLILGESLGSAAEISLADADYAFIGESPSDESGTSVAGAGDVDGDGLTDILIGAPGNDDGGSNSGKTYLFLGSTLAGYSTPAEISLADADCAFIGEAANDISSIPVAAAGDVDGDGLADILIGAKENDDGGAGAGKVYLIPGSSIGSGGITYDLAFFAYDWEFIGEGAGAELGYRTGAAAAGDVDGDGLDDILLGADDYSGTYPFSGKSYLFLAGNLPAAGSTIYSGSDEDYAFIGEAGYDYCGFSAAGVGDVNGDGLPDLLIGSWGNDDGAAGAGKSYLILGTDCLVTDTIYVDNLTGTSSGPGAESCPFDTINAGIQEAYSLGIDTVIVKGGVYNEAVTLEEDIHLQGETRYGSLHATIYQYPSTTNYVLEGANGASVSNVTICGGVLIDGWNEMTIERCVIYTGYSYTRNLYSLYLTRGSSDHVFRNNIFYKLHDYTGLIPSLATAIRLESNCDDNIFINNVIHLRDTTASPISINVIGVLLDDYTSDNEFRNNIIWADITANIWTNAYGFYADGSNITADIFYNKTPNNNHGLTLDSTNIVRTQSPKFVKPVPSGFNYHLKTFPPPLSSINSVCIDAGDPAPAYDDTDGTVNDMGAYGGPDPLEY